MAIVLDGTTGITTPDLTDTSLTSGRVVYAGTSGNLTGSTNLTFDGAILGVNGISVGRGAGAVASNTAVGLSALAANTSGAGNSAYGDSALLSNTTGAQNAAFSGDSLGSNTTGSYNTAVGKQTLRFNTTASHSTAVGYQAGFTSTGQRNAFFGSEAGYANTTGESNTYIGRQAGNLMTSGNNNTIIGRFNGNQNSLDIRTGSNYVVLSDGDGNPLAYTYNGATFCLQGAGYPQTGTGITFPATQSASSNANTLDDYEEGTWTPALTIGGSSTGITYAYQVGRYTKIGNLVTVQMFLELSSKGSNTGNVQITGLPFTVLSLTAAFGGAANGSCLWGTLNVSAYSSNVLGIPSTTTANVYLQTAAVATTGTGIATNATLANGSYFSFTLTYQV